MEAEVLVHTENPISAERIETNTAYLVYVALDDSGKPVAVPPLLAESAEEKLKLAEARERQARRLAAKK
jgi:acyl-CoA hydrolase